MFGKRKKKEIVKELQMMFLVFIPVFNISFYLSFSNKDDQFISFLEKKGDIEIEELPAYTRGWVANPGDGIIGCCIDTAALDDDLDVLSVITHECIHLADAIYRDKGMRPCEETRAYMTQYLHDQILNRYLRPKDSKHGGIALKDYKKLFTK